MLRLLGAALAAALVASADAAGVCYSPFYSSDYSSAGIKSLLERDYQTIAAQGFTAVRTYHAQFFGQNVVDAAKSNGLKVAIGIQMVGTDGSEYAYLEQDIQAAVDAAKTAPENVLAIYAGNENLVNGDHGSTTADRIVEVITRVKNALRGTPGANVPVGTVQRLNEWLNAADADKLAAACDVAGANIYPFFTTGGASDMKGTLSRQWAQFTSKYGSIARLTETGWPSQGSASPQGNVPSSQNAADYYNAFVDWTQQTSTDTPFYFMMFDVPSSSGADYEEHFGVATSSRQMKFSTGGAKQVKSSNSGSNESRELPDPATVKVPTDLTPTETPAPELTTSQPTTPASSTPAPTTVVPLPQPTTTPALTTSVPTTTPASSTPAPTSPAPPTKAPTTAPVHHDGSHASYSGSHADDIVFPHHGSFQGSHAGSREGSSKGDEVTDGSAGVVPAPTTQRVRTNPPAPVPAPVPAPTPAPSPAPTTLSPEVQAEIAAKEANSKVARQVSGDSGTVTSTLFVFVGFAGCASMIVAGVYMRRRNKESDEVETRTVAASSIDRRNSTQSVYDDPLGTRFSSIVMLTPNGDGVCIL